MNEFVDGSNCNGMAEENQFMYSFAFKLVPSVESLTCNFCTAKLFFCSEYMLKYF